jgi:hypothetical protein
MCRRVAALLVVGAATACSTADDDPDSRTGAEAAGCAAFFRKTHSGADVLDAIRRVAR